MNTKGKTPVSGRSQRRPTQDQAVRVLIPVRNKKRPNRDDIEILMNDRKSLESVVAAIMADGRLATLIAHAWIEKMDYVVAPREWLEKKLAV